MSPAEPLVSVIVACWNAADVLGRCMRHLLEQDYPHMEIVVVDDGSSDDSLAVAEGFLSSGRVTVVASPLNGGCPHARNLGLQHARGDLIAFIDADGFAQPDWVGALVETFARDPSVGAVASTVFFAANPMVVNGAGGTLNRQGWALDIGFNESFEEFDPPEEALYAMGCGMAVRRSVVDRVGPFDDVMLNYYDDVDYGLRIWRAGYRVVVARDAWIDHGWGQSTGDSVHKHLLCEQHRMRVVLKHGSARTLVRWIPAEWRATRRAMSPRHELRRRAVAWNLVHLPSTLTARWHLRGSRRPPSRLVDPSWGETFLTAVPPRGRPRIDAASSRVEMGDADAGAVLPYGWHAREDDGTTPFRWSARTAAAVLAVTDPAERLVLDFRFPDPAVGGVEISVRRLDEPHPVGVIRIPAEDAKWRRERHPLALAPGTYELRFRVARPWTHAPHDLRSVGVAVARVALESRADVPDRLDMADPRAEEQLHFGWHYAERDADLVHRWTGAVAVAGVRLAREARAIRLRYRLPPDPTGPVSARLRRAGREDPVWSADLPWEDGGWADVTADAALAPGDYELVLEPSELWTNPPHDDRRLGIAVRTVEFPSRDDG